MWLETAPLDTFMRERRYVRTQLADSDRRTLERSIVRGTISEPFAERICIRYLAIPPELIWPELSMMFE